MKKTIKLAVVAALALGATSAFATNGSVMIGVGAKSRGMGGVGIATGMGAESGYNNPALITSIKGDNEISFGGTLFMPEIDVTNTLNMGAAGSTATESEESDADMFVIPSVSLASKINDNWYWGLGMWGAGGLGTDFRDTNPMDTSDGVASGVDGAHMNIVTALQLMQFGVPVAYTTSGFSVGFTPIVQYSSLDIDYRFNAGPSGALPSYGAGDEIDAGAGVADDLAFGFNIGLAYEISGLTVGAMYKSEITFDVDDVLTSAATPFVNPTINPNGYTQDEMSTPEQYGVGISYTTGSHTLAVDWKFINWEDAEVYQDFGWEDQDVIAIGYEYATDKWALRCGYQYAESAVQEQDVAFNGSGQETNYNSAGLSAGTVNTFNLLGFPGTQESHVTIGGTYAFNETLSMDMAAVLGLENDETFTNFTGQEVETEHTERSVSIQLNYAF